MTSFITLSTALSTFQGHEKGYKHPSITLELSTFLPKNILLMHGKTFMKIKDLANFNKIIKYTKGLRL